MDSFSFHPLEVNVEADAADCRDEDNDDGDDSNHHCQHWIWCPLILCSHSSSLSTANRKQILAHTKVLVNLFQLKLFWDWRTWCYYRTGHFFVWSESFLCLIQKWKNHISFIFAMQNISTNLLIIWVWMIHVYHQTSKTLLMSGGSVGWYS